MQSVQDNHAFEMSLRDQLIAAQNGQPPPESQSPSAAQPTTHYPSPSQHDSNSNLDPSITGQQHQQQQQQQHVSPYGPMPPNRGAPDEQATSAASNASSANPAHNASNTDNANKKNAPKQRELSTTKRAAQNRAAQRAFRQRKEQYICKLEEDVKNYALMENDARAVRAENEALRTYIMGLQGQLAEANIDFAAAPPAVRTTHLDLPATNTHLGHHVYEVSEPSPPADHQPPPEAGYSASQAQLYHERTAMEDLIRTKQYLPHSPPARLYESLQQRQNVGQPQQESDQSLRERSSSSARHTHADSFPPPHQPQDGIHADGSEDEALPQGAINQLRAAAAQAGELHSTHSRGLPDGYEPASENPRPHKRPRHEEEAKGSTAAGVLASIVSRLHAITGTTPTNGTKA